MYQTSPLRKAMAIQMTDLIVRRRIGKTKLILKSCENSIFLEEGNILLIQEFGKKYDIPTCTFIINSSFVNCFKCAHTKKIPFPLLQVFLSHLLMRVKSVCVNGLPLQFTLVV